MSKEISDNKSIFYQNLQRAIEAKIVSFDEEKQKITYLTVEEKTYNYKDPEEKVRTSYFAELVLDYGYNTDRIKFEVKVPRRTPSDLADIAVYEKEDKNCSGEPFIIIECKRDGITDAEFSQAIEQLFGNCNSLKAKYGALIAGNTRKAFNIHKFPATEREKNVIADIPVKYGKEPKYKFVKGEQGKGLKKVSRDELIRSLEKCHQTVWQGGKLAPTVAFDEVSKLLFCKLWEEKKTKKGEPYKFQVGTYETPNDVFKRVDEIYREAKKTDEKVFQEDIRLPPQIVYNVVEHLQDLAIGEIDLDTKGIAFERFMEDFFKGKMGQFFTPREVIKFAVKMMDIKDTNTVLDPACGSGGFLLNAMDVIRKDAEENYSPLEAYKTWHDFASKRLFGIEINEQIARVCKMNMIIHDDGHTNVISTDALDDFKDIAKSSLEFKANSFDFILTNPPFGATVKETEKEKGYLDKFELGKKKKNQKTEILFIERCIEFLKPKTGKMAIILPDGILTNSSLQYVRDFIIEKCQILAVVSIPSFAFSHYGAGVKSSVVFIRRLGKEEKTKNYPIFMAIAEKIGYEANGREIKENDFDLIIEEFKKFETFPNNYKGV